MKISDFDTFEEFHEAREKAFYEEHPNYDDFMADNGRADRHERLLIDHLNYYGEKAIIAEKKAEAERLKAEAQEAADNAKKAVMSKIFPEETDLSKAYSNMLNELLK